MNKKTLIVLFVLFLGGLIVGLWLSRNKPIEPSLKPTTAPPTPTPQGVVLPTPLSTAPVLYSPPGETPEFPDSLPVLIASPLLPENFVPSLATRLGFNTNPKEVSGSRGTFLIWELGTKSLIVSPGTSSVSYVSGVAPGGTLHSALPALDTQVRSALASLELNDFANRLELVDAIYFAPGAEGGMVTSTSDRATMAQLNYVYALDAYHIFSGNFGSPSDAWIQLNAKGEVVRFSLTPFPNMERSPQTQTIIGVAQAQRRLLSSEGVLTSLSWSTDGDEPNYLTTPPKNIAITNTELGYFFDKETGAVAPVFIFRGTGEVNRLRVNTTTVVSGTQ